MSFYQYLLVISLIIFAFVAISSTATADILKGDIIESNFILMNPWTIGIFIRLKLALWAPLFEDNIDQRSFKETIELCINRGISPPQPPLFIRILEFEHLNGLTGILVEFPKNQETTKYINRERIISFLRQCREDKLGGEVHIASNILLRNNPLVNITKQRQEEYVKKSENYSMVTTFTITLLLVATTLSVISAYVIYYTARSKK